MKSERLSLQKVLPIYEQRPFGLISESQKWFEYTLTSGKAVPLRKKAVIVLAHPDDAEDILGGTIGKLSDEGFATTLVVITDGRWGIDHRNPMSQQQLVQKRLEETLLGAAELGIGHIINLGIEDREVPQDPKSDKVLLGHLVDVLKENSASAYITHATPENNNTKDYHADHRNTARLTLEAIQRSRNGNSEMTEQPVLFYADTQGARNAHGIERKHGVMVPRAATVDILIDTTSAVARKERAFRYHKTQIGNTPADIYHDYVMQAREVSRFRAGQARQRFLRNPQFSEGLSLHTGQGFSTDITQIFNKKDIFTPKRFFGRRSPPIFG